MFKKRAGFSLISVVLALAMFAAAGCESLSPKTKKGAAAGGVLGAIAGGVIGHQGGHGIEGAAIGAAAGALGGGLIGSAFEDSGYSRPKEVILEGTEKLGISDVIVLSKAGISDDVIIDKIARTGSVFRLSVEEIEALRKEGVSTRVVNYMMGR